MTINNERDKFIMPFSIKIDLGISMLGILLFQVLCGFLVEEFFLQPPHARAESQLNNHSNQHDHPENPLHVTAQWEGSPEGIAYSEFNHAFAGISVLLVGLSEVRTAMGWQALAWFRLVVPASLIGSGIFLLIWSDHEAWPIGSWTVVETFSGKDPEMLQHKVFGILALTVGMVEWFLRTGTLSQRLWRALLPGFALVGGLMLFIHMHGPHPAGHHIQTHHTVMGMLALAGGMAWFAGEFRHQSFAFSSSLSQSPSIFKLLWALLVFVIGVQLLFYSES